MIDRNETVLDHFTDDRLRDYATKGDGQRAYAEALLSAPPRVPAGH